MFLGLLDPDPDPLVRGMDPDPSILEHNNYLWTYDLYSPPFIMFWMCAYPLRGEVGEGPQKLGNSRAQPPPTSPSNGYAHIQNIMHRAV